MLLNKKIAAMRNSAVNCPDFTQTYSIHVESRLSRQILEHIGTCAFQCFQIVTQIVGLIIALTSYSLTQLKTFKVIKILGCSYERLSKRQS